MRFNTFLTVVITFFAFVFALGGGMLTAVRLTSELGVGAAPVVAESGDVAANMFPALLPHKHAYAPKLPAAEDAAIYRHADRKADVASTIRVKSKRSSPLAL
jgi:hypothetical protein